MLPFGAFHPLISRVISHVLIKPTNKRVMFPVFFKSNVLQRSLRQWSPVPCHVLLVLLWVVDQGCPHTWYLVVLNGLGTHLTAPTVLLSLLVSLLRNKILCQFAYFSLQCLLLYPPRLLFFFPDAFSSVPPIYLKLEYFLFFLKLVRYAYLNLLATLSLTAHLPDLPVDLFHLLI